MVDTPTTRNRLRKQELGTNTNTWGDDKLNEAIDAIDQALDGVESIALTGDKTLTTSNYTTSDESLNRVLKFTGTLTAAAVVTVPSVEHWYVVVNSAGAQVTVKTAAGAGVALANGATALVYCDGADVFNGAPTTVGAAMTVAGALTVAGTISGITAGTANTDAVNKAQMEAAIAAGGGSGAADGTVKVDVLATPVYLGAALTALGAVAISDDGDSLGFSIEELGLAEQADQSGSFTAVAGNIYPCDCTGGGFTATAPASPAVGDTVGLWKFGTGGVLMWGRNGSNVRGQAEDGTISAAYEGVIILRYSGATRGWV